MKYLILPLVLIFFFLHANAQQDPLYAQYLNNPLLLNPAYAGSNQTWQTLVGYRSQWSGLQGSPATMAFSSHTSLVQNRVGLGLVALQDRIGDAKNTDISINYSYRLKLDDKDLYFGLSTGMVRYTTDPGLVNLQNPGDAAFAAVNRFQFNTGAGIMLKSTKYLIGFSVPKMIPATIREANADIRVYNPHYYLMGAYLFYLSERLQLKPSILMRGTPGAPLSADVSATFILNQQVSAGLLTRNLSTYGVLFQLWIKKDFKFGYVFEVPTGRSVGANFTTHELTLTWTKAILKDHERSFTHF